MQRLADGWRPDVVVANLDLGDEHDGLSLLRRVKTLRMGTPVFMIEDRPQVDIRGFCHEGGRRGCRDQADRQ